MDEPLSERCGNSREGITPTSWLGKLPSHPGLPSASLIWGPREKWALTHLAVPHADLKPSMGSVLHQNFNNPVQSGFKSSAQSAPTTPTAVPGSLNIKSQNVGDNSLTPLLCLSALFCHITRCLGNPNDTLHFAGRKPPLQTIPSSVSVADESAPPEDIEKVASYVLEINLPLTPRELTSMLGKIQSIMAHCQKYKLNANKRNRKMEAAQTLLGEAQDAE